VKTGWRRVAETGQAQLCFTGSVLAPGHWRRDAEYPVFTIKRVPESGAFELGLSAIRWLQKRSPQAGSHNPQTPLINQLTNLID
jgi:hypothetical protein